MIEIIPAIDLIDGNCVRLEKGDFNLKKKYFDNPLEMAKRFEDVGYKRLHIVDLDGVRAGKPKHLKILQDIASQTQLKIDFSGGIRSQDDVCDVFNCGAEWIVLGSLAVKNVALTQLILETNKRGSIILGADTLQGKVVCSGWVEKSNLLLNDFISFWSNFGINQVLCTDVEKDGLMNGPSFELYKTLMHDFPQLQIIASGGISSYNDVLQLDKMGLGSVIVGKALYENISGFKF